MTIEQNDGGVGQVAIDARSEDARSAAEQTTEVGSGDGATGRLMPIAAVPSVSASDAASIEQNDGGAGRFSPDTQTTTARSVRRPRVSAKAGAKRGRGAIEKLAPVAAVPSSPADIITAIEVLGRKRRFCIAIVNKIGNALGARVRGILGWSFDLPEKEGEAIKKRAETLIKAAINGKPLDEPMADDIRYYVMAAQEMSAPAEKRRAEAEAEMATLAAHLPVAGWVDTVSGFSLKGLACIIAQTGDLSKYPNPDKVKRRLGLAPFAKDGVTRAGSTWARKGGLSAEDWTEYGYSKRKRAEVYAFIDDVMFRAQWRGDRDEDGEDPKKSKKPVAVPAHGIGPYGEAYGRKKADYMLRVEATKDLPNDDAAKWTPKRADSAARRYMAQQFVIDLWRVWRGQSVSVAQDRGASPPATDLAKDD